MNRSGLTIIETIMSLLIISLILFTAMTAQLNNREAILKTQAKMTAETMILKSMEYVITTTDYIELNTWIQNQTTIPEITNTNCAQTGVPILCDVFALTLENTSNTDVNRVSYDNMILTISSPLTDQTFNYIPLEITLEYVPGRNVSFTGELHE